MKRGWLTFAERGAQLPMTFGHEIAGFVEAVGDKVKNVSLGQQVLFFHGLVVVIVWLAARIAKVIVQP